MKQQLGGGNTAAAGTDHRDMIDLKRELNRKLQRKESPTRRHLEPTPPLRKTGDEDWSWSDPDGECPSGKSEVDAYSYAPLN